jgi:DNA-binding CsgD family transcriptional regulator
MLSKSWFLGADLRGWEDIGCVRTGNLRANGAADQLSLNTVEPNGSGCWFGSFQTTRVPLSDAACFTLTTVAQHLSAAHRLRRSSAFARMSAEQADAVFDARGRMDHATESTKGPAAHALLEHAVRAMGEVRSLRRDDGPTAAERWPSLIGVRWTLVEQHDVDGRTWVLAIDNRAKAAATLFSERERQVVQLALSGHENKAIAYDLGLATSTVRVLLSRAAAKVGAHSRQTLMKRAAQLGIAATKR